MRRKMNDNEKRNKIIGIKVKTETKQKLEYIVKRECTQISSYIDELLVKHIEEYFAIAHINWNELPPEEKEGREINGNTK